ncbi:aspartate kinase [Jeotgalicoccus halotolerans]|uniref:aspartate kinase n=1 Tax=Jeotgalicoccus halotolerans TaxID=157227 RepID=UPI003516F3D5
MKVAKFGGSSLSNATQIKKVASIVQNDKDIKTIVVSAPGKRRDDDVKVTDMLIALCTNKIAGLDTEEALTEILMRYKSIVEELSIDSSLLDNFESILRDYLNTIEDNDYLLDALKSRGEDFNAQLISAYFNSLGISAKYVSPEEAGIRVTNTPANARLLTSSYNEINKLKDYPEDVLVIPGFYGIADNGNIVTFARGGSDITGAIIARGIRADIYENYTDESHIYAAHPGIIEEPYKIEEITYREMRELAYAGFGIFHDEALEPLYQEKIPVMIRNTNEPHIEGTKIVPERKLNPDIPVIGFSCDEGFTSISLHKYLLNKEIGFTRRILQILEDYQISYEHMPSGIDDISIIMRSNQFENNNSLDKIIEEIDLQLEPEWIEVEEDLSLLFIVGLGMARQIGIVSRVTAALAEEKVNIRMMNQGSTEYSMMFAIQTKDHEPSIRALFREFF